MTHLVLIVRHDTHEDLLFAFSNAGIAAGAGWQVTVFFTGRAARCLKLGGLAEAEAAPLDAVGERLHDGAAALGMGDLEALMRRACELGKVRLLVCARGARIFDLALDDLYPEVEGIVGTATFLLQDLAGADQVITV